MKIDLLWQKKHIFLLFFDFIHVSLYIFTGQTRENNEKERKEKKTTKRRKCNSKRRQRTVIKANIYGLFLSPPHHIIKLFALEKKLNWNSDVSVCIIFLIRISQHFHFVSYIFIYNITSCGWNAPFRCARIFYLYRNVICTPWIWIILISQNHINTYIVRRRETREI